MENAHREWPTRGWCRALQWGEKNEIDIDGRGKHRSCPRKGSGVGILRYNSPPNRSRTYARAKDTKRIALWVCEDNGVEQNAKNKGSNLQTRKKGGDRQGRRNGYAEQS